MWRYQNLIEGPPQPDKIIVNGRMALNSFKNNGCPESILSVNEALRYGYLEKTRLECMNYFSNDELIRVLVLCDYSCKSTSNMLTLLSSVAKKLKDEVVFSVKFHPSCHVDINEYSGLVANIVTTPLSELLPMYNAVFSSNMTSAAVEAFLVGLKTIVFLHDDTLNFSPLKGEDDVSFVRSTDELLSELLSLKSSNHGERLFNVSRDFFHINTDLPRWKDTLERSDAGI